MYGVLFSVRPILRSKAYSLFQGLVRAHLRPLELAQLVQHGLDHAEGLVVLLAAPADLVHTQTHEELVDGEEQQVQVQVVQRARQRL